MNVYCVGHNELTIDNITVFVIDYIYDTEQAALDIRDALNRRKPAEYSIEQWVVMS